MKAFGLACCAVLMIDFGATAEVLDACLYSDRGRTCAWLEVRSQASPRLYVDREEVAGCPPGWGVRVNGHRFTTTPIVRCSWQQGATV